MRVSVIPQLVLGDVATLRVGDVLNEAISNPASRELRFAVAYMRLSGWDRLAVSIDALLSRGGEVRGAVGIDQGVTTLEALEALGAVSHQSTVFHTVSSFIYHPKLYLVKKEHDATVVVGSANLTREGLYRNVEVATAIYLDLTSDADVDLYEHYDAILRELLDTSHPNVQRIEPTMLNALLEAGLIRHEGQVPELGSLPRKRARPDRTLRGAIGDLFPPLSVQPAPPRARIIAEIQGKPAPPTRVIPSGTTGVFIVQLSAFDASHRTGVKGTSEILIPHAAVEFFPTLALSGRIYPDVYFDVILNTHRGPERHEYRLWYYEERAVGTRIDEYRLRVDHETIDLTSPAGGDLLVVNKLQPDADPLYEVTVLPRTDPTFAEFDKLCTEVTQGKRWGLV